MVPPISFIALLSNPPGVPLPVTDGPVIAVDATVVCDRALLGAADQWERCNETGWFGAMLPDTDAVFAETGRCAPAVHGRRR